MIQNYSIEGMTCGNCKKTVEQTISKLDGVTEVVVNLEKKLARITSDKSISTRELQDVLPNKYKIFKKPQSNIFGVSSSHNTLIEADQSKLEQLKPLFLILFYILVAANLLHWNDWTITDFMLDFMGLFLIVFSFFKMLDLKGFPESFSMYDPVAKNFSFYAKIYPFIETALGLMFLMRFEIVLALIVTLIILSITTYGVAKTLLNKQSIKCACLGTALKLPMTEATIIENSIMIVMAIVMLLNAI